MAAYRELQEAWNVATDGNDSLLPDLLPCRTVTWAYGAPSRRSRHGWQRALPCIYVFLWDTHWSLGPAVAV